MSTKKVIRGKRYSAEEKNKVVEFVKEYNTKNGRGGQLTASKKFGISQLTIANWLKKSGVKSTRKAAAKKTTGKAKRKVSSKTSGSTASTAGSMQKKLSTLLSLRNEIEKLERDLKAKQAQFNTIKASL